MKDFYRGFFSDQFFQSMVQDAPYEGQPLTRIFSETTLTFREIQFADSSDLLQIVHGFENQVYNGCLVMKVLSIENAQNLRSLVNTDSAEFVCDVQAFCRVCVVN